MLKNLSLLTKILPYVTALLWREIRRAAIRSKDGWVFRLTGKSAPLMRDRNIVIIGANFAGYHAARVISANLPPNSPYRVVVIEPNSHFQFTWVLPRFCVAKGHEHKAFIPYGGYLNCPDSALCWVKDRAGGLTKTHVELQDSETKIPYDYLIIATGSAVEEGLPSRVNATDKSEGMKRLQSVQKSIESAKNVVVVGGGAAGVEVATDAKFLYPDTNVILVHSRNALMHRFGKGLQEVALESFKSLGGETILEDRMTKEDKEAGTVTLRSGRVVECDILINCTGQKPASGILKDFAPHLISESGHIKVHPTLQLAEGSLSHIYACGDVADTKTPNPNSRSAMRQADVAADNILLAVRSKAPAYRFENEWADGMIKLTLGFDRSVTHMGDGKSELLWQSQEKDEALMCSACWSLLGQKPFEDDLARQAKLTPI